MSHEAGAHAPYVDGDHVKLGSLPPIAFFSK